MNTSSSLYKLETAEGTTVTSFRDMENERYYGELVGTSTTTLKRGLDIEASSAGKQLSHEDGMKLIRPVTDAEIVNALSQLETTKRQVLTDIMQNSSSTLGGL